MNMKININNCNKNKLRKILEEINSLTFTTPDPKNNLLRYVTKNDRKSMWKPAYLVKLSSWGVIKIHDKEIDVDGENIFYLEPDYDQFNRFISEFFKKENIEEKFCRFENNTLFLRLNDGTEKSISFETRRKTKYMLILFEILYKHWQKIGNKPLKKYEIRRRMIDEGIQREINDEFIKDTVSNIRTKIETAKLSDCVSIEYKRSSDGYSLNIRKPF